MDTYLNFDYSQSTPDEERRDCTAIVGEDANAVDVDFMSGVR